MDAAELTIGDVVEVNNVDVTLMVATANNLVEQLNAAYQHVGLSAASRRRNHFRKEFTRIND